MTSAYEKTAYLAYIQSQADTLYAQVAAQAVLEQLIASGYTEQQAMAYLQTSEGQASVAQAVAAMNDGQKEYSDDIPSRKR